MTNLIKTHLQTDEIKQLIADILSEATRQGATSAEVDVGMSKGFTVTARSGDTESIEYHQDKGVSLTVYMGQRSGNASLSDIRPEAIRSAVEAACNIARYTDEDTYSGLAEKELLAFNYPQLDMFYPWNITVEKAIELTRECEAIALSKDKRISASDGVTISTTEGCHGYGNTQGFIGAFPGTRHELSCVLIAKENKQMQRDYSYTLSCDPAMLESITQVAEQAVMRTVRRLNAKRIKTGRMPVIFIAEEARGLIGHFVGAIQGSSLYRKASFLLDHLGKKIFPDHIQIHELPHLAKGSGTAPFDDDGVATKPNVFIENGILKSYCLSVYSGRKLGLQTTGNAGGVHNLTINTGKKNLSELLKTMGTGLLVTDVMGQGVNIVTGDYSRGASGFWVENGEIQHAVEEITIAGNLRDIYSHLVEVGSDVDMRGNVHTGSVLLEEMVVAGD